MFPHPVLTHEGLIVSLLHIVMCRFQTDTKQNTESQKETKREGELLTDHPVHTWP